MVGICLGAELRGSTGSGNNVGALKMPTADERTITLHVAKWNVVLATLNLVQSIVAEIATQAAEQERAAVLANGPDLASVNEDRR